jgi:transposase
MPDRLGSASLRDSCGWRGYAWFVRYADGGGLTAEGRARRERVRLQAAEMFAQDADPVQIARSLRVSTKSVYQWRRAWRAGGQEALASRGPGGSACRLDEGQLGQLRAALEAGPAVHGWVQDQRWTLARAASLAARLFGVSYTLRGMSFLLHRIGYSPQVPVHRAVERDEAAIAEWRAVTWAKARG